MDHDDNKKEADEAAFAIGAMLMFLGATFGLFILLAGFIAWEWGWAATRAVVVCAFVAGLGLLVAWWNT